ncbi:MAG: benzoate-CoA ligase family protein [Hyphomicrobiales bacterium]|nr:benzoate-CoA ligase family protein [Hyphomicrobiales bacterium]
MRTGKQDHCVEIDESLVPNALRFSPVFNVAVPFIDRHVREGHGAAIALRYPGGEVSYTQLAENVARAGNVLLGLGVKPGERLVMAAVDDPMFFYVFWGAIKAGIVPVAASTFLKEHEYRFLIKDSECVAFVYSSVLASETAAVKGTTPQLRVVLPLEGEDSIAQRMTRASPELAPALTSASTDCFWLYSSGSTGNPKGVVHVHRDMIVTSERYGRRIAGLLPDDVVFCASKLFFSFGFGGGMTFPLWVGATIVLQPDRTTADLALDYLESSRASVFFGVPTLYGQMVQALDKKRRKLSSLRRCLSAGEALPAPIFNRWKQLTGVPILDGIGSTEVLHIFVSNRIDDIRPGSSGRPVPGYEVKIVGEDGQPVKDGEVGTLWVKGESNARCYWNNPEKTAATMVGEWLNTGDMYYVDSDGYYVNAGRGDDMLKVGGMWCSPIEIESKLLEHPKVREAAVVGRADENALIKPAAYLVLSDPKDGNNEMVAELQAFCKQHLAGFKYPRWFHFVSELPKTATGKIQRFKLRQSTP